PVICGSGNLWVTSNFSYKPIQIQVFEPSAESAALAEVEWRANCNLKTQRTPEIFRNATIRDDPKLVPVPDYVPQFVNFPLEWKNIEVSFTSKEFRKIWLHRGTL